MINSLQLWPQYRDQWGYYDAMVNQLFAPLDHNPCYRPRFYEVPQVDVQLMLPDATQEYTVGITPGSLIVGYGNADQTPIFTVQITDVSTGLRFWDAPVSNIFLSNNWGGYPSLLCSPRPVVGSGLFRVELWCDPVTAPGPTRVGFSIWVAEVVPCP